LPAPGTPERIALDTGHATMVSGLLIAGRLRATSWWHSEPHDPAPGVTCSCCWGVTWWTRDRLGWCCARCHPASQPAGIIEVTT
jgi:hypothetical protein